MNERILRAGAIWGAGLLAIGAVQVTAAPVQETQGKVVALHGGIGEEDRAAMERQAGEHNLRLTFARKVTGAYLSDVRVVIRDKHGAVVLDTVASGPWLFARLPAGEYTVAASEQDSTLTQTLAIKGAARRDWVFRFEAPASGPAEAAITKP